MTAKKRPAVRWKMDDELLYIDGIEVEAQLLASAALLERGEAALLKACHERAEARQRATALEQQVYTLRARCVRLATWAIESGALDPGSLMPGDLATEDET